MSSAFFSCDKIPGKYFLRPDIFSTCLGNFPLLTWLTETMVNCQWQEAAFFCKILSTAIKLVRNIYLEIGLSLPFHCMKLLTWLTATIMNWRWVGKLRWGKVLPGEPTEVKKLIRGSWWSAKTTDSEKGVDLKNLWLLFFLKRDQKKR